MIVDVLRPYIFFDKLSLIRSELVMTILHNILLHLYQLSLYFLLDQWQILRVCITIIIMLVILLSIRVDALEYVGFSNVADDGIVYK